VGFLVVLFFLSGAFKKPGWSFLVESSYINHEDNYGPLVDFLSPIQNCLFQRA